MDQADGVRERRIIERWLARFDRRPSSRTEHGIEMSEADRLYRRAMGSAYFEEFSPSWNGYPFDWPGRRAE